MRRICTLLLSVVLLLTLSVTAFAAEENLKIHTATAKKGETVYVTVELTESTVGNAMAVMYSYNEKHLKPVPASCSWANAGMLQDFDRRDAIGVWLAAESTDLKGGVCVLAFEVKTFAKFTETEISCTVSVKNGSESVGEYTATGKIVLDCQHSYDQWRDMGNLGHSRTCSLCDGQQTQSHEWNDGDLVPNSANPHEQTILYTCQICEGTRTQVKNTDNQAFPPEQEQENTAPTKPGTQRDPTGQETSPDRPNTDPTQPGSPQNPPQQDPEYQQGQQDGQTQQGQDESADHDPTQDSTIPQDILDALLQQEQDEHAGHDHAQDSTIPQDILDDLLQQEQDAHAGHDHDYANTSSATRPATGIAVVAVLAVLIGSMVYFVKKKH